MSHFERRLGRNYVLYTGGFISFVILLAIGEEFGLSQQLIGHLFLFATIAIYASIGVLARTADVSEYYVAGRRVPADPGRLRRVPRLGRRGGGGDRAPDRRRPRRVRRGRLRERAVRGDRDRRGRRRR